MKKLKLSMEQQNKAAIIRIEGKLELMDNKLTTLKDNHIAHIERDMRQLRGLVWFICTTVFIQMCYLIIRTLI